MQKGADWRPFFLLSISCTLFLKMAEGLSGTGRGDALEQGTHPSRQRSALPQDEVGSGAELGAWRMLVALASWMCRGAI